MKVAEIFWLIRLTPGIQFADILNKPASHIFFEHSIYLNTFKLARMAQQMYDQSV